MFVQVEAELCEMVAALPAVKKVLKDAFDRSAALTTSVINKRDKDAKVVVLSSHLFFCSHD